jgi:hypothetical protein
MVNVATPPQHRDVAAIHTESFIVPQTLPENNFIVVDDNDAAL